MLVQRLPDPGHVAVPEDPEAAGEEAVLDAVALDVLGGEKADEGLRCREPEGACPGRGTSRERSPNRLGPLSRRSRLRHLVRTPGATRRATR